MHHPPIPTRASTFRVNLPLPPGVNNQYVSVGRRRVLSAPAKTFNRDVFKLIAAHRTSGQLSPAIEQAFADSLLGIYLVYFFETPHRRDLDGGLKITLDALGRALGFDDRAVVDLHLSKRIDPLRPRVEVELETIGDWEFDRTYLYLGQEPKVVAPPASSGEDIQCQSRSVDDDSRPIRARRHRD